MKRVATFIFLGPLLVWLTVVILLLPQFIRNPDTDVLPAAGIALVMAFIAGLPPAFVLAGADHLMAQQGVARVGRVAICAALGFPAAIIAFFIMLEAIPVRDWFNEGVWTAGLYGIVPAALCSWFGGQRNGTGQTGAVT